MRLLVDRLEGKKARAQVFQALASGRADSYESVGSWASGKGDGDVVLSACNRVKAAAATFASAGAFIPDVEDIGELSEKETSSGGSILLPASESCLGTLRLLVGFTPIRKHKVLYRFSRRWHTYSESGSKACVSPLMGSSSCATDRRFSLELQ